jgi:hypothetical protein
MSTPNTDMSHVFAAQEARTREWVTKDQGDGTTGLVLFNCIDAMEQYLRLWLNRTGKPGHLWDQWYTLVDLSMEEACRLNTLIMTTSEGSKNQ